MNSDDEDEDEDDEDNNRSQDDFIAPTLRLIKGLENVLSDDDINAIIEKYLANNFGQDSLSKMKNNHVETHQQKAKVAAAIMDLISSTDPPENPHSKSKDEEHSRDEL